MIELDRDELEVIFNYCLGVATFEELEKARELIASNPQAARFCSQVESAIGPLDRWAVESCPDEIVENTISYVNHNSESGRAKLGQLLAAEKGRSEQKSSTIWVNLGRRLAMAAAFMIVGGIILSTLRYMRYHAWRTRCEAQLARIAQGISSYSSDYQGKLPAVATSAGSPWWKVGCPGEENVSNTRYIWLLPKGNYVSADNFICPGAGLDSLKPVTKEQVEKLHDFPDRRYISYSLRIICGQAPPVSSFGRRVVMSDMNPLFEQLPSDFDQPLELQLDDRLLRLNSSNHNHKGQNVLFRDGAVTFVKTRRIGANNDDIFTLRDLRFYRGIEVPACDSDDFLAP